MTEQPVTEYYGDYDVESFLGKGSIGKVYLARHRRIGRRVALKTVHLEQKFEDEEDRNEFYKRLQREAELCGSMQHPNVVTLYDVGYDGDLVSYLATEYVDGESLLARLRRTRPLPLDEALAHRRRPAARPRLRALEGIIHRDIKPANILLTAEGQAKIADFGVARPLHSSLTATRSLVGTPNYMSPEQVKTDAGLAALRPLLRRRGDVRDAHRREAVRRAGAERHPLQRRQPRAAAGQRDQSFRAGAARARRREAAGEESRGALRQRGRGAGGAGAVLREPATADACELGDHAVAPHEATTPLADDRRHREPLRSCGGRSRRRVLAHHAPPRRRARRDGRDAPQRLERQQPSAVITPAQIAQNAQRRALAAARAHADAGRYDEAIAALRRLLVRHPAEPRRARTSARKRVRLLRSVDAEGGGDEGRKETAAKKQK